MMSKRFIILLFLLPALITAATYGYTTETKETLSDEGLTDLFRTSLVHGWPWGYYAEVDEQIPQGGGLVIIIEYNEVRPEMLMQTYLAWLVVLLVLGLTILVFAVSRQG